MDIEKLAFEALAYRRAEELVKEAGLPKDVATKGWVGFKSNKAREYAIRRVTDRRGGKHIGKLMKELNLPPDDPGVQLAIRVAKDASKAKLSSNMLFEALAQQRAVEMLKEAGWLGRLVGLSDEAAQAAKAGRGAARSAGRSAARSKPAFLGHEAALPTQAKTVVNPRGVQTTGPHYDTLAKQQVKGTQSLEVPGWGMDRGAVSSGFGGVKA